MGNLIDFLISGDRRRVIAVLATALMGGLAAGYLLSPHRGLQRTESQSRIEWNKVQALPTRTPDAEDVEWQERANALDEPQPASANNSANSNGTEAR